MGKTQTKEQKRQQLMRARNMPLEQKLKVVKLYEEDGIPADVVAEEVGVPESAKADGVLQTTRGA